MFLGEVLRSRKRDFFLGIWNVRMDLQEVGGDGDWMELAQDRDRLRELVDTVMNFGVP